MKTTFIVFAILLILGMIHVQVEWSSVSADACRNRKGKCDAEYKENH